MMPSLDHCVNNPPEMTTLSNTLEVFDTYKHREDKDSDEESFHLPLDDDETECKFTETMKNGNGNESEDEILNKFESTTTPVDNIDAQLEDCLLNDEEDEKKGEKVADVELEFENNSKKTDLKSADDQGSPVEICENGIEKQECFSDPTQCSKLSLEEDSSGVSKNEKESDDAKKTIDLNSSEISREDAINSSNTNNVPKLDSDETSTVAEEASAITEKCDKDAQLEKHDCEKAIKSSDDLTQSSNQKEAKNVEQDEDTNFAQNSEQSETLEDLILHDTKINDKCENSNDSTKHHNEDSEDLFDISIIRDAEEDNAESAYNEAHPEENNVEENEDYDDGNEDKVDEDVIMEKTTHLDEEEAEEEMDIDRQDDHLKNDDVEIEEAKLECEGVKETISDEESDSSNKTDLVQSENGQKTSELLSSAGKSVNECRLDEVTGKLVNDDTMQVDSPENEGKVLENDSEGTQKRKSLKRAISEESEGGVAKKSRSEDGSESEVKEREKPKEKLPLRTLLSLSEFMKSKKNNKRLSMQDLEEFSVQKICEVLFHKSDLGNEHHQLKLQEQLIETMRKEIQQLTKQVRDLEIVNKKLMNDLKQQNATQKPLNPLKITRSVGLQVKFTSTLMENAKRRQTTTAVTTNHKIPVQTAPVRTRVVQNTVAANVTRQVPSPQKQPQPQPQQQLPKPNTPLLSQALQSRRTTIADVNKTPPQLVRAKPAEAKTGTPLASVIDLTDEDDKKDKNKLSPTKMVSPKNIAVPLRTTPMRVNATAQGIRLTTSQGKVSPITSVVTSSAPQVMYVVSSPQNVLTGGAKAVVVNFQSANGVLTSTLNGNAVSVIPKQTNNVQLKTVMAAKALPTNKVIKASNKHPAPLPPPPVVRITLDKPLKPIPPKPHLTIRKTETGIILQWKMPYELDMYEVIASYQLYAYQETSASPSTDMWRKVGDVKALALPMACTLTQFADKNKYYFAVRPVDIHKRIGMFSDPEEISL